jgi:hypothetical protein
MQAAIVILCVALMNVWNVGVGVVKHVPMCVRGREERVLLLVALPHVVLVDEARW